MKSKIINIFLFLVILSEILIAGKMSETAKDTARYLKNPLYARRVELFKLSKIKHADIVMLGNSLTEGANWGELLGRRNVANRGITGDILDGYLNRMQYVYNLHPKVCFIEGGINDIYNWTPINEIFDKYRKIIEKLKKHKIKPIIQSTLYTAENWGEDWIESHNPGVDPKEVNRERNREVDRLNALLRQYARREGIIFIDLNRRMSYRGFLRKSLTWDGAHLKARGYKIWAEEINKVLVKLGL